MKHLFFLVLFSFYYFSSKSQSISFVFDSTLLSNTIINTAIQDASVLLEKASNEKVKMNDKKCMLLLQLPLINVSNSLPMFDEGVKQENYEWKKMNGGTQTIFTLQATSPKAIANGIYGLLQEILGFQFYHPKNTITPNLQNVDFTKLNTLKAEKCFDKIGFHLHTMHPTELTEYLLDEKKENAIIYVKEYIDWLARNSQNYFEFNLLESINRKTWIAHAKAITDYAHSRGIYAGADISMHMLQQKAYQLYKGFPSSWRSKSKQIEKNAQWLIEANFDAWNVELSATEFTSGNNKKKTQLLEELQAIVKEHGVKIMSRSHVVKHTEMLGKAKEKAALPKEHGLMVHTVMFYSLTDSNAPVYRNKNLQHMLDLLMKEKELREVWYYPETAYWVTFDNSVPMLLLPYLSARLSDIQLCDSLNVKGHLTFSSGWEWGYWLFDWSVARWSWNITKNNILETKEPLQYLEQLVSPPFKEFIKNEWQLQEQHIKNNNLIKVMVAQTVTDEMKGKFNIEFHPRPKYSYKYIRNQADTNQLKEVEQLYLKPLATFASLSKSNSSSIENISLNEVEKELYDGLKITQYRALHRYQTLTYISNYRASNILKKPVSSSALQEASGIRNSAQQIVNNREKSYRYDVALLTTKRKDHTAYHFGYLYPVHNLHFWQREEGQAEKNKYKVFYKNIWSIARIIGLIN